MAALMVFALPMLHSAIASDIMIMPIDELQARSQFVILGTVTSVKTWADDKQFDIVEAKVAAVLKGKTDAKEFKISLRCRGHKGFDPAMKKGQHAVFFLNGLRKGEGTLTHFGSIAVIPNANFRLRTPNKADAVRSE